MLEFDSLFFRGYPKIKLDIELCVLLFIVAPFTDIATIMSIFITMPVCEIRTVQVAIATIRSAAADIQSDGGVA